MALASAVPVRVGVLSLVMWSPATPLSLEKEAMVGATGAAVSTVTLSVVEAGLVTPDTVSVAVKLWPPLARVPVVKLQAPLLLAEAVPSRVAPS